ncbi:hypothetical protein ACLB2K_075938 [Fragaria x ananassa]
MRCSTFPISKQLSESDQTRRLFESSQTGNVQVLHQLLAENQLLLHSVSLASRGSPLQVAAVAGHVDFVKEIVRLKPAFAEELNQDGFSPMHIAAANGFLEILRELLTVDSKLSQLKGRDQWTPLHYAAVRGRVGIIREMVLACPDSVEHVTVQGETVFHLAVRNSQFEAVRVLVTLVREIGKLNVLQMKDHLGNTVLHLATWKKQHQVVDWLDHIGTGLACALEVNNVNQSGLTALDLLLIFPSEAGDREMVELVRQRNKLDILNMKDNNGNSVVQCLLAINGTSTPATLDVNSTNQSGLTALDLLLIFPSGAGVLEIDGILRGSGALRARDIVHTNHNHTVLSFPAENQHNLQTDPKNLVEYFKFKRGRDSPDDARNVLLVVAVLVATVTYESALNPAGGLWQDTNLSKNGTDPPHIAGTSTNASYNLAYYIETVYNSIGFSVSLYMINILTTNFPLRLELQVCGVALYSTYVTALITISPDLTEWYVLFVHVFVLVPFLPMVVLLAVRLIIRLTQPLRNACICMSFE